MKKLSLIQMNFRVIFFFIFPVAGHRHSLTENAITSRRLKIKATQKMSIFVVAACNPCFLSLYKQYSFSFIPFGSWLVGLQCFMMIFCEQIISMAAIKDINIFRIASVYCVPYKRVRAFLCARFFRFP